MIFKMGTLTLKVYCGLHNKDILLLLLLLLLLLSLVKYPVQQI
jgi:hypothetical protein